MQIQVPVISVAFRKDATSMLTQFEYWDVVRTED